MLHVTERGMEAYLNNKLSEENAHKVLLHILECEECEALGDALMDEGDDGDRFRTTGTARWTGYNGVIPEPFQSWDNTVRVLEGSYPKA